jgi:translation initiation factor IF-3
VRLINADGENVGVVSIAEAKRIARDAELDLVEVAPTANPPVCRVMDVGKFIYERQKKRARITQATDQDRGQRNPTATENH